MFSLWCLLGILCGHALNQSDPLEDNDSLSITKGKQTVSVTKVQKTSRAQMIQDRLSKIEAAIETNKTSLVADPTHILQLCKGVKKYWKLLSPDQQVQLLYFEAQVLDLALSDLGRDSGVQPRLVIAMYQRVKSHKSSSIASEEFKSLAEERIVEIRKIEPYLILVAMHKLHSSYNGDIGVIILADQLLNHPDATPEMKENATALRKLALGSFGLSALV